MNEQAVFLNGEFLPLDEARVPVLAPAAPAALRHRAAGTEDASEWPAGRLSSALNAQVALIN